MRHEIKVGTVSWISASTHPLSLTAETAVLEPPWIPKTYLGLAATKNNTPPKTITDFKTFQGSKDFRALTYCHISFDADDATGEVSGFKVHDAVHDGGWTPPFSMRNWPGTALALDPDILSNQWYQGEASPLSVVNTQARHKNSAIKSVPADETVLINGLIKFRAGKHTDDIGVKKVKSPFHVPWVWCEVLVTLAKGKVKLYGVGSMFPSHAWYLNGTQVKTVAEVSDKTFPLQLACMTFPPVLTSSPTTACLPTNQIMAPSLNLYKVLSAGASAVGAQPAASLDTGRSGTVETHPNTVGAGKAIQYP